jgi:hypothetical protein
VSAAALLVAFARGGGSPPATYETVRVYEDGTARAVVGNAWPLGVPQDEAGSYEQRLAPGELATLAQLAESVATPPPSAPAPADAGRCELVLPGGRKAAWAMHAPPPGDLGPLVQRLRELLTATRRHPLGALALTVEQPELRLRNTGTEPVGLVPDSLRVTAVTDGAVDAVVLPAELAPGAETKLADAPSAQILVRLDAIVPYEGTPLRLECVLRT